MAADVLLCPTLSCGLIAAVGMVGGAGVGCVSGVPGIRPDKGTGCMDERLCGDADSLLLGCACAGWWDGSEK
jgi:hypothetical protein